MRRRSVFTIGTPYSCDERRPCAGAEEWIVPGIGRTDHPVLGRSVATDETSWAPAVVPEGSTPGVRRRIGLRLHFRPALVDPQNGPIMAKRVALRDWQTPTRPHYRDRGRLQSFGGLASRSLCGATKHGSSFPSAAAIVAASMRECDLARCDHDAESRPWTMATPSRLVNTASSGDKRSDPQNITVGITTSPGAIPVKNHRTTPA